MKKSVIYKLAQCAVLTTANLSEYDKLTILRELMGAEDLAKFTERQQEKANEAV